MISVSLNKNNKDEFSSARVKLNSCTITLDYSEYQELAAAIASPEIFNCRGEKIN